MATLADELLLDFDDSDHDGSIGSPSSSPRSGASPSPDNLPPKLEIGDGYEEAKAKVEKMELRGIGDIRSVASLMSKLEPVLKEIAHYSALPPDKHITNIDGHPEYKLLTEVNTLSTSIDNEIILVHKFIRDHYSIRFPSLETLVTGPLDYAKTVAIIGNGPMDKIKEIAQSSDNMVGHSLQAILAGPTLMVVTVEAITSQGREMTPEELQTVLAACKMALDLAHSKETLVEYVQSRMRLFAPNLTSLIGPSTAGNLISSAGGLASLAKMPACNLAILGTKKKQAGLATNVGIRNRGFIYDSPIIRSIPKDLISKAIRIVSAKIVLCARIDLVHSSRDGASGEMMRQECLHRLDKLAEPPPNKSSRALPAPDDKPSRKRGGRRARKAKEATAMTDLRKAQNRMAFGKEEEEVGYGTGEGTKGLGMIGQANDGKIRTMQIDQRTRAKLSKNNKGWGADLGGTASSLRGFGQGAGAGNSTVLRAHGLKSSGARGAGTTGTASTIAFTPVQGLELVDPRAQNELKRKREAEDDRWFKSGTFTQVGDGAALAGTTNATTNGGFKVPQLTAKQASKGNMGPPTTVRKD